jgi:PAS domain S-box-containing protein
MSALGDRFERSSDPRATALEWFEAASSLSLVMVGVADMDLRLVAVNDAFAAAFGRPAKELAGGSVEELSPPGEVLLSRKRVGRFLSGAWDAHRGWRTFERANGERFGMEFVVRSARDLEGAPRYLLFEARETAAASTAAVASHVLGLVGPLVRRDGDLLCVVDVERMTCRAADAPTSIPDTTRALPEELALDEFLGPDEYAEATLWLKEAAASHDVSGPMRVSVGTDGSTRPVDVIVRRWPGSPSLLIALCRDVEHATQRGRGSAGRIHELETALSRVVDAALDVLGAPNADAVKAFASPVLDQLSRREREVVLLLLRGSRVPDIAGQLFVAPSTVRNHLSRVFRKFGVASQSELLHVLLERD